MVVVLPAPLGPKKPKTSPGKTSRLRRLTAILTLWPNSRVRYSTTRSSIFKIGSMPNRFAWSICQQGNAQDPIGHDALTKAFVRIEYEVSIVWRANSWEHLWNRRAFNARNFSGNSLLEEPSAFHLRSSAFLRLILFERNEEHPRREFGEEAIQNKKGLGEVPKPLSLNRSSRYCSA